GDLWAELGPDGANSHWTTQGNTTRSVTNDKLRTGAVDAISSVDGCSAAALEHRHFEIVLANTQSNQSGSFCGPGTLQAAIGQDRFARFEKAVLVNVQPEPVAIVAVGEEVVHSGSSNI